MRFLITILPPIAALALTGCYEPATEQVMSVQDNLSHRELANFIAKHTGTARYWDDYSSTEFDATVHMSSGRRDRCNEVSNCAYAIDSRINFSLEGVMTTVMTGSDYFDRDGFYLASSDSDGVTCTSLIRYKDPQSAFIGESGEGPKKRCSDGMKTQSSFWSLTAYHGDRAELNLFESWQDGSGTALSFLINPSGNLLGIKMEASGIDEDGMNFDFRASNY
jgi:hypothetical protein